MGFQESKRLGEEAEKLVERLYQECGFKTSRHKIAEYDISVEKPLFTTEVKFDIYEARSGNMGIEIYNTKSKKPSGLTVTKATLWAHVLADNSVNLISVIELKRTIDSIPVERKIESGGDDNASLWLFRTTDLLPFFTRIDNIDIEARTKTIKELIRQ